MATLNITSANLNTLGDAGSFETAASGWGFMLKGTRFDISRINTAPSEGTYNAKSVNLLSSWPSDGRHNTGIYAGASLSKGDLVVIQCKVRVPSGNKIAGDTAKIIISSSLPELPEYKISKSVADASDAWVDVQAAFRIDVDIFGYFSVEIDDNGTAITQNGEIWVDDLRLYTFNNIPHECTLKIDIPNTTITNESGAGADDGSIAVAVTGGTSPFEYQITGPVNVSWQSSNTFNNLPSGIYTVEVRESNYTTCMDSWTFVVNETGVGFDFTTNITDESIRNSDDGKIEVTVTGTGSPFTYSAYAGSSAQDSNILAPLSPGFYTVVVTDSGGNIVGYNVEVKQGDAIMADVHHHLDPIIFEATQTDNASLENYKIFIDVKVEDEPGSGVFVSKLRASLPPESDGKARFNISSAFKDIFSPSAPAYNETSIRKITDISRFYKIFYGDTWGDMGEPTEYFETSERMVVFGGVSKAKFPDMDYFATELPANKRFLTWAPKVKFVDAEQEDYLLFYVYNSSITALKLMARGYFDDETTAEGELMNTTGVKEGELYLLPAGPLNADPDSLNTNRELEKYDLWLTDQNDNVISEVRTYRITEFKELDTRYLMFLNSLGAFDIIRTTGILVKNAAFERVEIEKYLPHDYQSDEGQYESGDVAKRRKFSYSTGYLQGQNAADWWEYMQELMMSRKVYDVTNGERKPIVINARSIKTGERTNHKRFVRFEAAESYLDYSYTPENV